MPATKVYFPVGTDPNAQGLSRKHIPRRDRRFGTFRLRSGADAMYGESDFAVVDAVRAVADERGSSSAQVSLAWLLQRPGVAATVLGATRQRHLAEAIDAVDLAVRCRDHPCRGAVPAASHPRPFPTGRRNLSGGRPG